MTTGLAAIRELRNTLVPREFDGEAAEAVASGLRDAKADNTRRAYASAWQRLQAWADAGGHQALPATPGAVALYLGYLAAAGPSHPSSRPRPPSLTSTPPPASRRPTTPPATHWWRRPLKVGETGPRHPGRPTP